MNIEEFRPSWPGSGVGNAAAAVYPSRCDDANRLFVMPLILKREIFHQVKKIKISYDRNALGLIFNAVRAGRSKDFPH